VLVELLTQRALVQPRRTDDLSALVQGALLALLLPPNVPWWLILVGVVVMIVIGKQLFSGVGGYPLNPVLMAWAVLLLSWGNLIHPIYGIGLLGTAWIPSALIGGGVLAVLGHIKWQAPLGMITGVTLGAVGFGVIFPETLTPTTQLASGSFLLGAFFLATDTTCSPANPLARLLFGVGAGLLVVILRLWGTWPEPVPFALLLMNLVTPLLDRIRSTPIQRVTSHA
jgi:electron transport complex protein RnfD